MLNAPPLPAEKNRLIKPGYRADVDGLRALAIIAVIVNHYYRDILPSGYLGVDIFFVISGYVITSVLTNKRHLSFKDFILDFYQRRVKRLLPALLLCVVITSLIGFLFIPPASYFFEDSWKTGISALFGFSNLYLLGLATDYFDNSAELNLFTQTWSLGVEEQFYLLFPLMVWLAGFSRQNPRGKKNLFVWVGAFAVASVASFVYLSGRNFPASYFMMTSRFWELGAGCLVFLLADSRNTKIRLAKMLRPEILMAALMAALFIPLDYQVEATLLVVVLTGSLIASSYPDSPAYRLLTLKPVVATGLISYSLYLWHWSVLVISRWTIGIHWWSFPVQMGMTFFLAYISYRYIESPLRYLVWSTRRPVTITYGLAASMASAVLLAGLCIPFKGYLYTGTRTAQMAQITSGDETGSFSFPVGLDEAVHMKARECNMTPQYLKGADHQAKPVIDRDFFRKCLADPRPKVILAGDSFAAVIGKHIALAAGEMGYQFKMMFGYVCPYPLDPRHITESNNRWCDVDPAIAKAGLLEYINPGDIVVIRLNFPKPEYIKYSKSQIEDRVISAYDKEIESLYHAIAAKGGSLLLIGSNPAVQLNPECLNPQWFNALQGTNCREIRLDSSPISDFAIRHDQHLSKRFSGRYPGLEIITPTSYLCDMSLGACPLKLDGQFLYKDNEHITSVAVELFYPEIRSSLQRLAGK